jgi:hypothetical protein
MLPCQWICSDYAAVNFDKNQPDIIFSSLFCHHFTNEELVSMLQWMKQNSRIGFFYQRPSSALACLLSHQVHHKIFQQVIPGEKMMQHCRLQEVLEKRIGSICFSWQEFQNSI